VPVHRGGSGLPVPWSRTFAAGILPCAHSMLPALRHPAYAGQQRRLSGHGQPLAEFVSPRSTGCQPVSWGGAGWKPTLRQGGAGWKPTLRQGSAGL